MIGVAPPRLLAEHARIARWKTTAFLAVILCGAYFTNPDRPLPFDVCVWKILTGWSCPTCGLTRALCHALHGDWQGSVRLHPLGPIALAVLVGWTLRSTIEAWRGRPLLDQV